MPNEIVGRLLRFRYHFMVQGKHVPKTIRLSKDKVDTLSSEISQYLGVSDEIGILLGIVIAKKVLGMRIIEV